MAGFEFLVGLMESTALMCVHFNFTMMICRIEREFNDLDVPQKTRENLRGLHHFFIHAKGRKEGKRAFR